MDKIENDKSFSQKDFFFSKKTLEDVDIRLDTIHSLSTIERIFKEYQLISTCKNVEDKDILTTEFIENQIENSISTWTEFPWSKNGNWEQFLEFVLPYKVWHDYPENWRGYFKDRYSRKARDYSSDTLSTSRNSLRSGNDFFYKMIVDDANLWYKYSDRAVNLGCAPSLSELLALKEGDCYSTAYLGVYIMRAFGIPSTIDIVPLWGSKNGNHATEVFVDSLHCFQTPSGRELSRAAKVFRLCFVRQGLWTDSLSLLLSSDKVLDYLRDDYIKDVTNEHTRVSDIEVKLNDSIKSRFAYICVYNYGEWQPVYFGKVDSCNLVTFRNMACSMLYRIAVPCKEGFEFVDDIFLVDSTGLRQSVYSSNAHKINMKLEKINSGDKSWVKKYSKYDLYILRAGNSWEQVGAQLCEKDSIIEFRSVPANGVYRLLLADGDKRLERIFSYTNTNKQFWY